MFQIRKIFIISAIQWIFEQSKLHLKTDDCLCLNDCNIPALHMFLDLIEFRLNVRQIKQMLFTFLWFMTQQWSNFSQKLHCRVKDVNKLSPLDNHLTSVCMSNWLAVSSFFSHNFANTWELRGCAFILLTDLIQIINASCSSPLSFLATRWVLCRIQWTVTTCGTFCLSKVANRLYLLTMVVAPPVATAVMFSKLMFCSWKYSSMHLKIVSRLESPSRYFENKNSSVTHLRLWTKVPYISHQYTRTAKRCLIQL
jgi:hypothetical protein